MASEGIFSIFVESVVEDVIKQHGTRPSDIDMASRRAEEAAARRYEAAAWLRRTVGVVGAKDLPEEPSEEEFRIGLRNGIILCNALNKVQPGAIPKVVEAPPDSFVVPDGAPLTAYQYFENLRNFLVTLEGMGLSTFEASDLERGGKGSRVVDSVLALKFYIEAKQAGKDGSSKFGGTSKPASLAKHFIRKSCEPFMNSISRSHLLNEKPHEDLCLANNFGGDYLSKSVEMKCSHSLNLLVRTVLSNKKPEEVPLLVESMLNKVMQEFELCIADQSEMGLAHTTTLKENQNVKEAAENELRERLNNQQEKEAEMKELKERLLLMEHRLKQQEQDFRMQQQGNGMEEKTLVDMEEKALRLKKQQKWEMEQTEINDRLIKQHLIFDRQQKEIKELKLALSLTKVGMEDMKSQYLEEFGNLGKQLGTLANAASKYHKVLEENRKLYNQIQDLKGNIRVYCRVRPFLHGQASNMSTISRIDDQNITIASASKNGKDARRNFTFNKVFGPTATQEEIFSDTQPLIQSVLDGYNVCIFAYGQTGSGKTHTMSGPKELNEKTIGVNYRALNDLFYLSEQQIRNSTNKGLSVPDANIVPVRSTAEVIEIMNIGQKNRAVSSTAMNDRSSRSHSCLTIHVQGKELTSGNMLRGCMHLVDLAGSERVDKSEKSAHVPYRNSKLTQLLQDSLGGQAKTLMFVHISPEADALSETLSTLKFAERVATVELGAARVNKDNVEVKELKEQIAALKATMTNKGADEPLRTTVSSLDLSRMKPSIVTTNHEEDEIGYPTSNRKPMEEVGNIEISPGIPAYNIFQLVRWENTKGVPSCLMHGTKVAYNLKDIISFRRILNTLQIFTCANEYL
ncbi:hypothetical protein HPP92_010427 [Vanilla planifolia]|uniref:Uncharacterized protein n=1 Tax=Vanilla planifolia TaxID=51239 RepID=A0A835R9K7_VANPL|nr:hypothetical protein HPP92_010427 [Vanilla planifolia]